MAKQSGGQNTAKIVEELVRPVVQDLGFSLWDVRFEKEGPDWYLRVFVERDQVMDTDACELVARAIDPVIDAADPISQSYYMEVGSPGLGRRLARPEHFQQYLGQKVAARLIRPDDAGRRELEGTLQGFENGFVTLACPEPLRFELAAASFVKLCDDDNLF